ncbi:hypothetical protein ACE6H2_015804 [Prunus campanulata]
MDYVDACYHTQTYFKAYENLILPMNGMELWDRTNMPPCVPPSYSKQPGRPRKARRKEAGECSNKASVVTKVQDSLRCGQCGRKGHNKRTCHRNLPTKTKIKKRKAEPARSVQKGKWKRKATNAAGSSKAPPTDSATPSSTPATGSASLVTGSAPPASTEASTGNSYLLRKRPMVVGASDLIFSFGPSDPPFRPKKDIATSIHDTTNAAQRTFSLHLAFASEFSNLSRDFSNPGITTLDLSHISTSYQTQKSQLPLPCTKPTL